MIVSIIIPIFNVAPYIEVSLESVMRQTFSGSMECLLVDDCGTDDSIAIAENMIKRYNGPICFKVLHHIRNLGLSAARNTGTFAAVGDYLYYMDSDDVITDDCIEKLWMEVEKRPDLEMVQGNVCRHTMENEKITFVNNDNHLVVNTNYEVRRCFQNGRIYVNVWNKLLRRDFILNNEILCREGLIYEDNLWLFFLLKFLKNAAFIPDITYHQQKRPNSITTTADKRTEGYNYCNIHRIILDNLTPGYEREEFFNYGSWVADFYVNYIHEVPEYEDVFRLYYNKAKEYGSWKIRLEFMLCNILGRLKNGLPIWIRIKKMRGAYDKKQN